MYHIEHSLFSNACFLGAWFRLCSSSSLNSINSAVNVLCFFSFVCSWLIFWETTSQWPSRANVREFVAILQEVMTLNSAALLQEEKWDSRGSSTGSNALEWCCSLWRMSSPLTSGGNILNYSVDFLKRGPSDCCLTSSRIVTQNWSPFTGATKVKSWKWTHNIEG